MLQSLFLNIYGKFAKKRMFKTGQFGFMSVTRTETNDRTTFVMPLITLPREITSLLAQERNKDLLEAFTELNYIINHDWLHSIFADSLNSKITKISSVDPVRNTKRRVENGFWWPSSAKETLANPVTKMGSDWFEAFQMRFHAEALGHMLTKSENPLEQAISNYMKAWKKFKRNTITEGYMSDPAFTTPARFALRMLAFNLVRAIPYDHPIIQNIINDKDVGSDQIVFNDMYKSLMTGVIFGNGKNKSRRSAPIPQREEISKFGPRWQRTLTTRKYSLAIKHTVSRALKAADEDAIEALGLEKARPRIVRPSRAHRLKQTL